MMSMSNGVYDLPLPICSGVGKSAGRSMSTGDRRIYLIKGLNAILDAITTNLRQLFIESSRFLKPLLP
jgi:hypothetical protein